MQSSYKYILICCTLQLHCTFKAECDNIRNSLECMQLPADPLWVLQRLYALRMWVKQQDIAPEIIQKTMDTWSELLQNVCSTPIDLQYIEYMALCELHCNWCIENNILKTDGIGSLVIIVHTDNLLVQNNPIHSTLLDESCSFGVLLPLRLQVNQWATDKYTSKQYYCIKQDMPFYSEFEYSEILDQLARDYKLDDIQYPF